jgi:hypothetical protein
MFGQLTGWGRVHRVNGGTMSARKIQIGQLWKKKETGDTFLVTRVYNEALSTFVVLRKSGSEGEDLVRVKVERTPQGQGLPGFVPAMEDDSL